MSPTSPILTRSDSVAKGSAPRPRSYTASSRGLMASTDGHADWRRINSRPMLWEQISSAPSTRREVGDMYRFLERRNNMASAAMQSTDWRQSSRQSCSESKESDSDDGNVGRQTDAGQEIQPSLCHELWISTSEAPADQHGMGTATSFDVLFGLQPPLLSRLVHVMSLSTLMLMEEALRRYQSPEGVTLVELTPSPTDSCGHELCGSACDLVHAELHKVGNGAVLQAKAWSEMERNALMGRPNGPPKHSGDRDPTDLLFSSIPHQNRVAHAKSEEKSTDETAERERRFEGLIRKLKRLEKKNEGPGGIQPSEAKTLNPAATEFIPVETTTAATVSTGSPTKFRRRSVRELFPARPAAPLHGTAGFINVMNPPTAQKPPTDAAAEVTTEVLSKVPHMVQQLTTQYLQQFASQLALAGTQLQAPAIPSTLPYASEMLPTGPFHYPAFVPLQPPAAPIPKKPAFAPAIGVKTPPKQTEPSSVEVSGAKEKAQPKESLRKSDPAEANSQTAASTGDSVAMGQAIPLTSAPQPSMATNVVEVGAQASMPPSGPGVGMMANGCFTYPPRASRMVQPASTVPYGQPQVLFDPRAIPGSLQFQRVPHQSIQAFPAMIPPMMAGSAPSFMPTAAPIRTVVPGTIPSTVPMTIAMTAGQPMAAARYAATYPGGLAGAQQQRWPIGAAVPFGAAPPMAPIPGATVPPVLPIRKPKQPDVRAQIDYEAWIEYRKATEPGYAEACKMRQAKRWTRQVERANWERAARVAAKVCVPTPTEQQQRPRQQSAGLQEVPPSMGTSDMVLPAPAAPARRPILPSEWLTPLPAPDDKDVKITGRLSPGVELSKETVIEIGKTEEAA